MKLGLGVRVDAIHYQVAAVGWLQSMMFAICPCAITASSHSESICLIDCLALDTGRTGTGWYASPHCRACHATQRQRDKMCGTNWHPNCVTYHLSASPMWQSFQASQKVSSGLDSSEGSSTRVPRARSA